MGGARVAGLMWKEERRRAGGDAVSWIVLACGGWVESCCWGLASGDVAPWIKRWADGEITQGSGYNLLSFEVMAHGSLSNHLQCLLYRRDQYMSSCALLYRSMSRLDFPMAINLSASLKACLSLTA